MRLQRRWIGLAAAGFLSLAGSIVVPVAGRAQEDGPPVNGTFVDSASIPQPETVADLVEQAIQITSKRRLTAGKHTPWQIVHGILALRWDFNLMTGQGRDEISAIEWIAGGATHDGMPMWEATPYGGRGHPFTKPYAFEGHPTQFMGYMTMANIPLDYEFQADSKVIRIRDIINDAKMQVAQGPEITWTLWALSHYEEPDAQWFNSKGEPWSIERLVKLQVDEPVTIGACGGTHGLFALCYARNMYLSTGKPLRGVWLEADQKIKRYVLETRTLQNRDGSFSSKHFTGREYSADFGKRIATSGHQLEWLMVAVPQSKLKEQWLQNGIARIARDLIDYRNVGSDCGPLYHALHGLVIYRQRTVPQYLVPQCTSELKLSDRRKILLQPDAAKSTTSTNSTTTEKAKKGTKKAEIETEKDVVKTTASEKAPIASEALDSTDSSSPE